MGWIKRLQYLYGGGVRPDVVVQDPQDDSKDGGIYGDKWGGGYVIPQEVLKSILKVPKDRYDRYRLYRDLDEDLLASVIDLYAEEATQYLEDDLKETHSMQVRVTSKNKTIEDACNDLLKKIGFAWEMTPLARSVALYGDLFTRLVYAPQQGVQYAILIKEPDIVSRIEDKYGILLGFKQDKVKNFRISKKDELSYPWDFIHYRNRLKPAYFPYGTSIADNAIRSYRQLIMAEDSALLYRLLRHPDRLVHYIDVGQQGWIEAQKTLRNYERTYRNKIYRNQALGQIDHRYHRLTPTDDIFLGRTKESGTMIEKMPGSTNAFDVHDIDVYINKFFSAVRVPKAFLGFEQDVNARATLTNQSSRFARSVRHLQDVLKLAIRQMLEIHLTLLATHAFDETYDWEIEGNEFHIEMGVVSYITELDWIDVLNMRLAAAAQLQSMGDDPYVNPDKLTAFAFRKIMKFDDKQLNDMIRKTPREEMLPPPSEDINIDKKDIDKLVAAFQKDEDLTDEEMGILKALIEDVPTIKEIVYRRIRSLQAGTGMQEEIPLPVKGGDGSR